jgi:hypothetical protein
VGKTGEFDLYSPPSLIPAPQIPHRSDVALAFVGRILREDHAFEAVDVSADARQGGLER